MSISESDSSVYEGPSPGARSQTFPSTLPIRSETSRIPSGYYSPLRHHKRTHSLGPREVKETLDACLEYGDEDNGQGMRINQYTIKQEIGRGSYGAVHLAVDQTGQKYAMKEFSKTRLRKRSQSNILRRPHMARGRGGPRLSPPQGHRRSASQIHSEEENGNPLFLIREEIAIMKKLDHENIIKLYEVLDDPDNDSLYMVMEYCAKGVVMKVGLGEKTTSYSEEQCRLWFRDMILGIEYLHSQGIIHRDIKPDNLILNDDDCLKIVDFGVSEFFKKGTNMFTGKAAGSPAFWPPELCRVGHGEISGEAADIWSMGITLYCLCFGCLPFNITGVLELYEAIRNKTPEIPTESKQLKDVLERLLDKNPETRIKMCQLREHPWVTRNGEDCLLSFEENTTAILIPTEDELNHAITKSISHVLTIVKAVNKLKSLRARSAARRKAYPTDFHSPPLANVPPPRSRSLDGEDSDIRAATHAGAHLAVKGVHAQIYGGHGAAKEVHPQIIVGHNDHQVGNVQKVVTTPLPPKRSDSAVALEDSEPDGDEREKSLGGNDGHARPSSSLSEGPAPFLHIGSGAGQSSQQQPEEYVVSESPTGTDECLYDMAFEKKNDEIRSAGGVVYSNVIAEERGINIGKSSSKLMGKPF